MAKPAKAKLLLELYRRLHDLYGDCGCPLEHASPFQLLAAVMLSAQCRDERVNLVTKKLFAIAPDAASMAATPVETIAEIIRPCGLFENKSRNLRDAAAMLVEKFGGEVPRTMEELTALPGIGRKSANVLLGNAFDIPGFPVDTHVKRLLNRIGFADSDSPETIEREVNADLAPEYWSQFSHLLIRHGRRVCSAAKPRCEACAIASCCRRRGVAAKGKKAR